MNTLEVAFIIDRTSISVAQANRLGSRMMCLPELLIVGVEDTLNAYYKQHSLTTHSNSHMIDISKAITHIAN